MTSKISLILIGGKMGRVSARGVDDNVISSFKESVLQKHDKLHSVYGYEIENALKVYLTLKGNSKYSDDPEVKAMLGSLIKEKSGTHTQPKAFDVEEEIKEIKERLDKLTQITQKDDEIPRSKRELKKKVQRYKQRAKNVKERRDGPMDMFASIFKDEYSDYKQVSWKDIA